MSAISANPAEMIRLGAPRMIRTDKELAEYTKVLFTLTAKPKRTAAEEDAVELMTFLVEQYESQQWPISESEPVDVLIERDYQP